MNFIQIVQLVIAILAFLLSLMIFRKNIEDVMFNSYLIQTGIYLVLFLILILIGIWAKIS